MCRDQVQSDEDIVLSYVELFVMYSNFNFYYCDFHQLASLYIITLNSSYIHEHFNFICV